MKSPVLVMSIIAFLLCRAVPLAFPQEATGTLRGRVTAEAPIPDASVGIQETGELATTDSNGYFSLETSARGAVTLVVAAPGYQRFTAAVTLPFTGELHVTLEKQTVEMGEIEVESQRERVPEQTRAADRIPREQVAAQPTAGDPFAVIDQEEGVVQPEQLADAAYTLPSVTMSLSESGRSTYSVYGADSDFNLFYYDYIRIPFNKHAQTGTSVVPSEAVGYVQVSKGIAPLEYGPGIGGFFQVVPDSRFTRDSTLLLSPGSDEVTAVYKRKLSEDSGLLLAATKSLTELTMPVFMWGYTKLYDSMGFSFFSGAPVVVPSYGDVCVRYFTSSGSQSLTLDGLGYYDWTRGSLDMLGDYDVSTTMFPFYGAVGFHWTAPPMPSVLNDVSAYASIYTRTGAANMDMDLESFLSAFAAANGIDPQEMMAQMAQLGDVEVNAHMHEVPSMNVTSFEGKEALSFFLGDAVTLTTGLVGRYSMLGGSYEADTDITMRLYGLSMSQKYTVPRFEIHEDVAKVHAFASLDATLPSVLDLHAGAAYSWFPLHGFSAPSLDAEVSSNGTGPWSASLRAGWSIGAYDEFAYLERRMNEKVLGVPQSSSYASLPSAVAATGKIAYTAGASSTIVLQPYFCWYYGLSGLALYASYLDPYRSGADARDLISITQMLDPDTGLSTGASLSWQIGPPAAHWELSYLPSLTMYHKRENGVDAWFSPNTDVRHVFKGTCSFELPGNNDLSAALTVYVDKPFTPERVVDPSNGTLVKEAYNSARDLVPRFSLGLKWERDAVLFGKPGRTVIDSRNLLSVVNPTLVGMKTQSLTVAGASTGDFANREYSFFRTNLVDILGSMEIRVAATYSL